MNRQKIVFALGVIATSLYGCYNDNAEDLYPTVPIGGTCDTSTVTYSATIRPIIETSCATSGCHLGIAPTGYDFSTHVGLASVANSGKLIVAIEHTGPNPMPQDAAKLDNCTIAKIKKWVSDGAPNN